MRNILRNIIKIISIVCLFALPIFAHAASLYFSPSSGSYTTGEQFRVKVLVSSTDVKMNAVGADISFSPGNLELISISETTSLIDVWGEKPSFSNNTGRISFEGLILDGYQGLSGEIVTLIFRAKSPGETAVRFSSGSVLAYNGLGTNILSGFQNASFVIEGIPVPTFEIPESIPDGFQFTKNLKLFDNNIDVAYLQLCLTYEGLYLEDITGYFDSKTKDAIIDFQEKYFDDILEPWGFTKGTGLVYRTTREKLNDVCPVLAEKEKLPEQLFDISVRLESETMAKASELEVVIVFESFGKVPTSVDLTYTIVNDQKQIVFRDIETVLVETEKVVRKRFSSLSLSSGSYTLVVKTQYNIDVIDEFSVDFTIVEEVEKKILFDNIWFWIWLATFFAAIIIFLLSLSISLIYQRFHYDRSIHSIYDEMKKEEDVIKKQQKLIKKRKLLLRQISKDLTDIQEKIKQDLEEINNQLKEE